MKYGAVCPAITEIKFLIYHNLKSPKSKIVTSLIKILNKNSSLKSSRL